CLQDIELPLTF
nr:immunoglobulin light chain junction region [Macaca mulatta]MOX24419.1 immunoglobulin light chain junction region [Macaca mulatta]MOX25442.1 immunoglobulin light chain junction region [Macaca mulatta]MOX26350.1 immunoglobulin light chain junction region [Macaca mulatta]MOX26452.1 immunoglobulin light chain junction region [Macaca mulatta]